MTATGITRPSPSGCRAKSWTWVVLGLCLAAQAAPLLATRVLPFHDAPGLLGLAGVFAHTNDPAARISDFYDIDPRPTSSSLTFAWAYAAAKIGVPVDLAFHVFIALFCLAGPPLALAACLRAFGRPPALALLALPVGYHHQIWYGFLGSAAAVPGLLLALACAKHAVDKPRIANHLGLAGSLAFVALAHPFSLALTLAVVAPFPFFPLGSAAAARTQLRIRGLRLACFVPAALLAAVSAPESPPSDGEGPSVAQVLRAFRFEGPSFGYLRTFVEWLGGGYANRVDEIVVGVALVCLVAFLVRGVRAATRQARPRTLADALWLGWAAGALALGYWLLPDKVYWPTYWWGVRVRCVLPLFLVAVAAVRATPRGLPVWAAAPAAAAGLFLAAYTTWDFRTHFRGRVLSGFDAAIAAIPPGKSLLAMPAPNERHYRRGHPYLGQYYVVRKGGRAAPYLLGHRGPYWVTLKPPPESPPWGDPGQFVWHAHAAGYDYFLVELPAEGPEPDPFREAPAGAVTLISGEGRWALYRRERL